jgi:hypothetical protein
MTPMTGTIELNSNLCFVAEKIDSSTPDWVLSAKF